MNIDTIWVEFQNSLRQPQQIKCCYIKKIKGLPFLYIQTFHPIDEKN